MCSFFLSFFLSFFSLYIYLVRFLLACIFLLCAIWVWPETLVWIVPRCSESDPNPMDQSADPSPMDQTDESLDPSPRHENICTVALHPTTFSPIHCEGGGFPDQGHPVCGKPVLKFWPL